MRRLQGREAGAGMDALRTGVGSGPGATAGWPQTRDHRRGRPPPRPRARLVRPTALRRLGPVPRDGGRHQSRVYGQGTTLAPHAASEGHLQNTSLSQPNPRCVARRAVGGVRPRESRSVTRSRWWACEGRRVLPRAGCGGCGSVFVGQAAGRAARSAAVRAKPFSHDATPAVGPAVSGCRAGASLPSLAVATARRARRLQGPARPRWRPGGEAEGVTLGGRSVSARWVRPAGGP